MSYKSAYKELMRDYEADRDRAQAWLDAKRDALYASSPRARAIDAQLNATGLDLARLALAGDADALTAARALSQALRDEKAALIPEGYYAGAYRCGVCEDTGYVPGPDGLPARCACLKQRLIEKYYDLSNLRGVLETENFDTFDLHYYSQTPWEAEGLSPYENMRTLYRVAEQFAARFGDAFQNLFLYGDTGLGKTFISHCIAKDLLDKGRTVLYVTAPRLFKTVEDNRFNRDEMDEPDETLEAVTEVDLLIVDDLGTEFATVVTSSALFDIINQRLLARKPTIISTNLSARELEDQYSGRIGSRFFGHFDMLKFFGDDIRILKKYIKRG